MTLLVFSAPRSGGQLHAAWQGVMLTVHQLSAIRSIQVNTLEWSGHTLGGKVTLGGAARVFRGTSSTTGAYMSCRTRVFFSTLSRSNRQTEADTERQRDCVCVCVCVGVCVCVCARERHRARERERANERGCFEARPPLEVRTCPGGRAPSSVQGYLAHKKTPPPRTLQ